MLRSAALLFLVPVLASAQEVLQEMPRYDRYQRLSREIAGSFKSGAISTRWADDGKKLTYRREGKQYVYDLATGQESEGDLPRSATQGRQRGSPDRGRQYNTIYSADGKLKAFQRDRNVFLSGPNGGNERQVTMDGDATKRIKNGVASWVYGEELEVREAMWFSPDAGHLAYYRFDESRVKDYFLALNQTKFQSVLDVEPYPKAGSDNPKVELWIARTGDLAKVKVDTALEEPELGEYVYDVTWSPDGKELLFKRTNRLQNRVQLIAADPGTGKCRVLAEDHQPQSWAENHPTVIWSPEGDRFLWGTERNGYRNLDLYSREGKRLGAVTQNGFDLIRVARADWKAGKIWFMGAGPENPYYEQLYVVGLDGKGQRLLTDPKRHHQVTLSPDGSRFVDVEQTPDVAPRTVLRDGSGKELRLLAESDLSKFDALGLKRTEVFTYLADDGKTTLYGTVQKPSDFDPARRYPVIVSVYGGPESGGMGPRFETPSAMTEFGFLVVELAGRGTMGRGKAFRDAVYGKLGVVEIADQAAGVRALANRPYVDGKRVGIFGTSYGGYASLMALLQHPDVFRAACASSSVTDWRHYDTIYTERYMGLPALEGNGKGYDAGSGIERAGGLRGALMLFFGSADNNVHPSNTYMLIQALEKKGRRYDLQVGPDQGHSGMSYSRMLEHFLKWLVVQPNVNPQRPVNAG